MLNSSPFKSTLMDKSIKQSWMILLLVMIMMATPSQSCTCLSQTLLTDYLDSSISAYTCDQCSTYCYRQSTFSFIQTSMGNMSTIFDCADCSMNCTTCTNVNTCTACDIEFFVNTTDQCENCSTEYGTKCLYCNQTQCTQCVTDYFLQFSANNRTCANCSFYKCISCTDGPTCTACQPGYFLNSILKLCMPCYFPCKQCSNTATNCTICYTTTPLYYYDASTYTCRLCYHAIANCAQCDPYGTVCSKCKTDLFYIATNYTCQACAPPCLRCLDDTHCITCIDNNHTLVAATNLCSLCTVQMPYCLSCLTPTVCLECDASITPTRYLTYPPTGCVQCAVARPHCLNCTYTAGVGPICSICDIKYYSANNSCFDCPLTCSSCTSATVCDACINPQHTLDGSQMCVLCSSLIPNCLQCTSTVLCHICTNNTVNNTDGSGSCMSCNLTQYPDHVTQVCYDCVNNCQTCTNVTACLSCDMFYQHVPATLTCKDLCGDSVVITDQCDNGLGVINDGCSDKCTIQTNYICTLTPTTMSGVSVSTSSCSYTQKLDINLIKINKQPYKNILTWTYSVKPYLYGLPGTTSRIFTDEELKKTFLLYDRVYGPTGASMARVGAGLSGLTVESVSVDPVSSLVTITLSYQKQVSASQFQMMVSFSYLYTNLSLPYFSSTPDSDTILLISSFRSKTMLGQFYTTQQYDQCKMLSMGALAIAILSFLAFVVGIFSKELVGLQMVMLCQFVYISLFYYKGTLQLPFFALKQLLYSTGYNIPPDSTDYTDTGSSPPQAWVLGFDPVTFSSNFNLMAALYIIPLIAVIPFIPLKAKCIRKLSTIQMGHKWVDLLLGEIYLFCVLFNYQYFLFGLIAYYQDGRNTKNYSSSMIIWFGGLATLCSFAGLIFKPQIYGNFRTVFRFDSQLRSQVIEQKQNLLNGEQNITAKFQSQRTCHTCITAYEKIRLFINENYFWRKWRTLHTALTYNHYNIMIIYFTLVTLSMALIKNSELIVISLSAIMLIQMILMRPFGQISQKLRGIYFFTAYTLISVVRYMNNQVLNGEYNIMLSAFVLLLLAIALIWTYVALISYFYSSLRHQMSNRNIVVSKVFNNEIENQLDKQGIQEQEEALMRKLMKRYERIELQYNLNDARNQLLSGYGSTDSKGNLIQQQNPSPLIGQPGSHQLKKPENKPALPQQIVKMAEQTKNFKDLKEAVQKQKKKKKKAQMKNKVSGQKMLKLLSLDNFNKYEQQFLMPEQDKKNKFTQKEQQLIEPQIQGQQGQQVKEQVKVVEQQQQQMEDGKDAYESVQPKNLQQAKEKLDEQKILMQQNTHIRYKRAIKLITNNGLQLDQQLIQKNYHKI